MSKSAIDKKCRIDALARSITGCTRQTAARLIHEWLLIEKREADEPDIRAALVLKDLYDCHACVNHVAQVYVKGIMLCRENVFGMQERVLEDEAFAIAERAADRRCRKHIGRVKDDMPTPIRTEWDDRNLPKADYLVDVRSPEEYGQGHLEGSRNIPLEEYCRNPYALTSRIDAEIIMVCGNGIKSKIAAEQAVKAGFTRVSYMGMKHQDV